MFLITTADERYWKPDEKILFLGEWCKRYNRKHVWSKLDHETVPYHWDDRSRLFRDYQYLAGVYEQSLAALALRLDHLHGESRSTRYWRIIIGPWLRYFIEALYDRFLSLESAIESGKVTGAWLERSCALGWVPADFQKFLMWSLDDPWNQYIYGRIASIRDMPGNKYDALVDPPSTDAGDNCCDSESVLRRFAKSLLACVPSRLNRIVLVSSYLARGDQARLQIALGQVPYPVSPWLTAATEIPDLEMRRTLLGKTATTQFGQLLEALIPEQIPIVYVEGYRDFLNRSLRTFPGNPQAMFTANAVSGNEAFKFWAACQCERGAKLYVSQHGGHNGTGLWSSFEDHEIRISDRYYTWGWKANATGVPCVPLSAGPLIRAKRLLKSKPGGQILWVSMSLPRYAYQMYSVPVGPQMIAYFADQQKFAKSVDPKVLDLLLLRPYPHDYGWDAADRIRAELPLLKVYQGQTPLIDQLNQSRLFVGTYNSTTYLETLVADYPTIVYWNPAHWELRASAQAAFEDLRQAGILHDTPGSAAAKVNEIYRDPQSWWREQSVQQAKERFCAQFAVVQDDWLREWKTELLQLKGHSRP